MLKNQWIILLFALFSLSASAQKVKITGIAKSYEYKDIYAYMYSDYISNQLKELTFSYIDSAGNFELNFSAKEITFITLKINKHVASLYIEPTKNYELIISPPDSSYYSNPNTEQDVAIQINLKSKTEINALTIDYEKRFDNFLTVNYPDFVSRRPENKIDSFKLAINNFYSTVNNPFFNQYITYSIGALEEKTKKSEKKLYENYLQNKPILYKHPEYMNFFNAFYKQKLQTFSKTKEGVPLTFNINNKGSYAAAMETLERDVFLKNDTIRELVLIKGLYECYYDGSFEKQSIKAILTQIIEKSKIEEHKLIAQNCLNSFSKLQKGSAAPFFELPDKNGVTHSIDELRNKQYVYVMFYESTCLSCLQQMKVIPSLKKQYGERIQFVSISNDNTNADLKNFCAKNPKYDWLFLYDDSNGKLKKEYEIITLPAYFLISPDGKFVQVPADSPEGNIEQMFYDIVKPKNKLHNIGNKRN